jgi:hypothetical protein
LQSFRYPDNVVFVPINDAAALRLAFSAAESRNEFIESFFVEPVMGEGVPGK